MSHVTLGIVGLGYWGPNLLRNFQELPQARVKWICDKNGGRLAKMKDRYEVPFTSADVQDVVDDPEVDAVVVALPVSLHHAYASRVLEAGKHCLVEKPLATSAAEARSLREMAADRGRILMVGHTFEYNEAVRKVKSYIQEGLLGDVYYVHCQRVNLGIIRQDVNALWSLAPHDISILLYWLDAEPIGVSAQGFCYLQKSLEDLVTVSLEFPGNRHAQIFASWLSPEKVRKISIVGSKKMIVYDDVSLDQKILIYDKGVEVCGGNGGGPDSFGEFQMLIRSGDLSIPKISPIEPLRTECSHFIDCCLSGRRPLTDGENGLRVVRVLEACDRSMKLKGAFVPIDSF